jgi:hypothetical protein
MWASACTKNEELDIIRSLFFFLILHMYKSAKLAAIALVAVVSGGLLVNAAKAWNSVPLPDCDADYILGRDTANVDRPGRLPRTESNIPLNTESSIRQFFGTGALARAIMLVPNSGISNVLAFNQTMYRGYGQNAPEVRDRFMAATFNNILKMECRARITMYYLGFPMDRYGMASVNDAAAYDKNARNHSLYQRTDDLEQQIRLMRQDIANLARAMNAGSFQAATEPFQGGTSAITAPAPVLKTPSKVPDTMSASDAAIFKACTDACAATGKACSSSSKTPQECTVAEASCSIGCLDSIKH